MPSPFSVKDKNEETTTIKLKSQLSPSSPLPSQQSPLPKSSKAVAGKGLQFTAESLTSNLANTAERPIEKDCHTGTMDDSNGHRKILQTTTDYTSCRRTAGSTDTPLTPWSTRGPVCCCNTAAHRPPLKLLSLQRLPAPGISLKTTYRTLS